MKKTFEIGRDADGNRWITCLRDDCDAKGRKSYHPQDVSQGFCGGCDRFHVIEDVPIDDLREAVYVTSREHGKALLATTLIGFAARTVGQDRLADEVGELQARLGVPDSVVDKFDAWGRQARSAFTGRKPSAEEPGNALDAGDDES
ncbi:MAG: hypothetical protein K0U62_11600 [Actinomycetia bacterium]|nr:hypothetical protein [Actinomycetes bacterium]